MRTVCLRWDRVRAAKELLKTSCQHGRGPGLHYGGDRGADWLFVGFVLVRDLLLAAKCLVLAAVQP